MPGSGHVLHCETATLPRFYVELENGSGNHGHHLWLVSRLDRDENKAELEPGASCGKHFLLGASNLCSSLVEPDQSARHTHCTNLPIQTGINK